ATGLPKNFRRIGHILFDRIGMDAMKKLPGLAKLGLIEGAGQNLEGPGLDQPGISYHERAAATHLSEAGRQLGDGAPAEQRGRRKGEGGDEVAHSRSSR